MLVWFCCGCVSSRLVSRYHREKLTTRTVELEAFLHTPERRMLRNLTYLLTFVLIAFLTFIDLVYGIKFSPEEKNAWLIGCATGLVAGMETAGVWVAWL